MDRPIGRQPTWPRTRSHLIEEERAGGGAARRSHFHSNFYSISVDVAMAFNYRLQYWEARFPNNCTGSINISLRRWRWRRRRRTPLLYEFILHVYLSFPSTPFYLRRHRISSSLVIIVAQIGEAETRMGKTRTRSRKEESAGLIHSCARENDCSVMHFSRNPFPSSREHRNTFSQIRHCSFHSRFFDYSDNICAAIFRKVPKIHLVSALLHLAVTWSCRVLWS